MLGSYCLYSSLIEKNACSFILDHCCLGTTSTTHAD
jgi:hypothetical protein